MRLFLTFVLLTVSVHAGRCCPDSCDCREFPKDSESTGNNLSINLIFIRATCIGNVTQKLPESTEVLVLRDMLESNLKSFLTSFNKNLTEITVTDVNLANVTFTFNLSLFNQLKSLKISYCKIVSSPNFVKYNATNLQSLDLSNNKLESFKINPIETLEVLNISANAIESLNALSFEKLSALKSLDLTGNILSVIDDKVLNPLVSLQHLNLSKNRLEILNEASFSSLLHLQQLDVSWNRLAKVAPGSLQLPSLARLLLAGNPNLGNFQQPALLVGTGRRLQTVDASRTGLKQVPAALTHSIRTLRLAGNSITTVNCGDLDSYPLLQLLDFTSNNLESVEDDALGRLDSLYVLYLTDNKLRSIPRSLPERLRVLHLEKNKIEQIRNVDLQGLPFLEVLLLGDNKIKTIEENSFIQLTSLETLDLSRNPISILTAGTFSGPIQLRALRLSKIQAIPPAKEMTFPLSSPEHLVILDLSHSPGLARQLLADTAALAAARELQELDLSNSILSHVRSDLLHFLPQLRIFRLHGNPLNCTDLQWLALWMRKQDDAEYRKISCSSPPELWGTLLIDLLDVESGTLSTESINETSENISNAKTTNSEATNTTEIFDGITTYKTLGNESSTKLGEMSDDEVSTTNYTTENSSQMSPNGSSNTSIVNETHIMTNDIRVTDNIIQNKINLIKDESEVHNVTAIDKAKQKIQINNSRGFFNNITNEPNTRIIHYEITNNDVVKYTNQTNKNNIFFNKNNPINESNKDIKTTKYKNFPLNTSALNEILNRNNATKKTKVSNGKNVNNNNTFSNEDKAESRNKLNKETASSVILSEIEEQTSASLSKTQNLLRQSAIITNQLIKDERKEEFTNNYYENEENTTTTHGKTSMYSGEKNSALRHPGMLILIIGIIGAAIALITVTSRFSWRTKNKRNNRSNSIENVEVTSIPSVTELW